MLNLKQTLQMHSLPASHAWFVFVPRALCFCRGGALTGPQRLHWTYTCSELRLVLNNGLKAATLGKSLSHNYFIIDTITIK